MKAGDKVVCIRDDFTDSRCRRMRDLNGSPSQWPKKGRVYVVREVVISPANGKPGLKLVGIICPVHVLWGIEMAFSASRFRPVAEVGHPPIKVERPQELEARP